MRRSRFHVCLKCGRPRTEVVFIEKLGGIICKECYDLLDNCPRCGKLRFLEYIDKDGNKICKNCKQG